MSILWVVLVIPLTVGLYLLVSYGDLQVLQKVKLRKQKNKINFFSAFSHIKPFQDLERRIEKSNIRFYIPYNPWIHLGLCLIMFFIAGSWMNRHTNMYLAFVFGAVAAIVPYIVLQLFSDIMGYRVRKMSVDFLNILRRFLVGGKGNDIFAAFKKASKYVLQPLKNYIEIFIYEYEHKVNPIQCFENLRDRLENNELKLYIDNLQICYVRGGDMIELTDTFISEIDKQNDDEDEENARDTLLSMGLYILLGLNFLVLYVLFNSSYKTAIFESLWGQVVFTFDMVVSFYIAYLTLERPN